MSSVRGLLDPGEPRHSRVFGVGFVVALTAVNSGRCDPFHNGSVIASCDLAVRSSGLSKHVGLAHVTNILYVVN